MYRTRFIVQPTTTTGYSRFPLDMLRYDQCCPATQEAVEVISKTPHPSRPFAPVELVAYHLDKINKLTDARWRSFGWMILPQSLTTERVK